MMMYVNTNCSAQHIHLAHSHGATQLLQEFHELSRGWGIPTATDFSLAWATATLVFGEGHPAIQYLLMIMALDDAAVVTIVAVFYGDHDRPVHGTYLIYVLVGMVVAGACAC